MEIIKIVTKELFAPGEPGFGIFALMMIAVLKYFAGYIARTAKGGSIAEIIDTYANFQAIAYVAAAIYTAFTSILKVLGY